MSVDDENDGLVDGSKFGDVDRVEDGGVNG